MRGWEYWGMDPMSRLETDDPRLQKIEEKLVRAGDLFYWYRSEAPAVAMMKEVVEEYEEYYADGKEKSSAETPSSKE